MNSRAQNAIVILGLACLAAAVPVYSQTPGNRPATPPAGASAGKADAYYNYAMAHLYAEEAAKFGGRPQFVNQAIEYYKKAMALDPGESVIGEELAEFYMRAGQAEKATELANKIIGANPNDAGAEKILARMYASQLDPEQGKVDPEALRNAIQHYQRAADIDPKDAESLSSLAHLYRVARNDAAAEKAYKAVIALDAADDDALTGLAELYAGKGDFASAIALLEPITGDDGDPNTIQILAELYEDSRDFGKAADTWKRLVPLARDNQIRHKYCDALLKTNRIDEAIAAWTDLAAAEPKSTDDLIELADLWGRKRNYAKAHEALARAKAIDNNLSVRMSEAELMDAEGKSADAIATVEEILKETKKPVYADAERMERIGMLRSLANMEKNADKTPEAVLSYRQIADLKPDAAPAVEVEVIETLAEARDYKGARAASDAALKKFSGDKMIIEEHASLLATLGEYDKAIGELKGLPDADQDQEVVVRIAQVQEKGKRYKEALATLDAADGLAKSPQQKLAIAFMRGAMYEHEKNYDEAEKQFRLVLKADPENAGALNYLGYMLADRNVRLDEAQQLIAKAVDLEPESGAYLDSLGWVHYRQNRLDQAEGELRQALDSREDRSIRKDPTVHDHLAEVYFKQGKFKEAAQEWELAVSEMKTASPSESDPAESKRIAQRLEEARSKISAKAQK
jgi:tetratricopeptide (TPR) repeat protein